MSTIKTLLISNTAWSLYNFRLPLANALKNKGHQVVLISPNDSHADLLKNYNWKKIELKRSSINPMSELKSIYELIKIYKDEKPTFVHHFTIKCVIYGSIAALVINLVSQKKISILNSITGLGHVFIEESPKTFLLRPLVKSLYKIVLNQKNSTCIFQNKDDLNFFIQKKILSQDRCQLIRSSGVDLSRFNRKNFSESIKKNKKTILFASRLIKEKGILDFMEAIKILDKKNIEFQAIIAGSIDSGNPSSLTQDQINQFASDLKGRCQFIGHIDKIEEILIDADLFILPSYREGVPRVLLEASAMNVCSIATDVPGCREVIDHEINGLLTPVKNPEVLAQAIESLLLDDEKRKNFAAKARKKIEENFTDQIITAQFINVYESLN